MTSSLRERSRNFAEEVSQLLDSTIGCPFPVVSLRVSDKEKYVIRPAGDDDRPVKIPLRVDGEHLADLELVMYQTLDRSGEYLKTSKTDFRVFSTIDRTPLIRLEYDSEARTVPTAHWQFHAERGAFSHLLTIASRTRDVRGPGDLSKLHLPVGGERFRPGLEDVIELLVRDCGIDAKSDWESAVMEGRKRWRLRQLLAAVRDQQDDVAELMRSLGWSVDRDTPSPRSRDEPFTHW